MGVGEGDHVLIDCSLQPILGPSKLVYIIPMNPWHFGRPVLPLLMGLNLRSSRLIYIRVDESELCPDSIFEPTGTAQENQMGFVRFTSRLAAVVIGRCPVSPTWISSWGVTRNRELPLRHQAACPLVFQDGRARRGLQRLCQG